MHWINRSWKFWRIACSSGKLREPPIWFRQCEVNKWFEKHIFSCQLEPVCVLRSPHTLYSPDVARNRPFLPASGSEGFPHSWLYLRYPKATTSGNFKFLTTRNNCLLALFWDVSNKGNSLFVDYFSIAPCNSFGVGNIGYFSQNEQQREMQSYRNNKCGPVR